MTTPARRRAGANGHADGFDLSAAVAAAAAEQAGTPFAFTWKGKPYSLPPSDDWPVAVTDVLGSGDLGKALALLLGQQAYDQLAADGFTLGALNLLFDKVAKHAGFESLPNSPAPGSPVTTRT